MRRRLILCLVLTAAVLAIGRLAVSIEGTPSNYEQVIVTDQAIGITAALCRVGRVSTGSETPALVQVLTNGIYYRLDSATATPMASDFYAPPTTVLEIGKPTLFRAVQQTAGKTAYLVVTCFQK